MKELLKHIINYLTSNGWKIYRANTDEIKLFKIVNKEKGFYTVMLSSGTSCIHVSILYEKTDNAGVVTQFMIKEDYSQLPRQYEPFIYPVFFAEIYSSAFFNAIVDNFKGKIF